MANIKISELPQISFSSITNNDVIPIVDVVSNTTSKVLISDLKTFFNTLFTGGTISGSTIFQNGLTANTISATTYLNLPQDIFVTGGTFSGGVITFVNNSGGTFGVSGISSFDTFVTGFTYSNNELTILQNSGNPLSVTINTMTGLTVNGTLSATTISGGTLYGDGSNLTNIVASGISYDNISSGLSATTVQDAIDELNNGNFQYQNGNSYNTFMMTSDYFGSSSNPYTPNLLLAYPIYVQQDVTIDAIRIGITAFAVGSLVIGLYDCVNGLPSNLLFQTTAFNTGINGYQLITVGNQIIKKGIYYVTYNCNSTPSTTCVTSSSLPNVIGWKNSSGDGPGVIIGRNYVYDGTLPSTWGTVTSIYPASIITVVPSFEFRII